MVDFENLVKGAKIVGFIILAIIGVYSISILGGIVVGVLSNVVVGDFNGTTGGGSINISNAMITAIQGYEGTYISTVTTSLTALPTIAALVIVVVLILIFFGRKMFNLGGDSGDKKGGVQ